jgi:pimeloyl-ACP methyl ester carboxylesterase
MKRWKRNVGIFLLTLLLVILIGPFLIPIPPLVGTVPAGELTNSESRFVEIEGLELHYTDHGQGQSVIILLHGFGASLYSWHEVVGPLTEIGRVVAFDRPAFGLTERPDLEEWPGQNPYSPEFQVELVVGLMDALSVEQAILIGNSAGGTVAVNTALTHPDRVQALVLVDAAIYQGGGSPAWIRPLLRTPQMRRLGPWITRSIADRGESIIEIAWHDPSRIDEETIEGYRLPLQVDNWDRALWEYTLASYDLDLDERLDEIQMPVLVITGDDDRIVPTELSLRLAENIQGADLVVIADCGHVPHEECPLEFMAAVEAFTVSLLD